MNTLQLKPVSGYHREELDDEGTDSLNIVFPRNVTSMGNPHFSSNVQLVHEDSSNYDLRDRSTHSTNTNENRSTNAENYSISFITTNNVFGQKRPFWSRLTQFEKISFFAIILLGMIIFTLALILLTQPSPLLQVHLTNEDSLNLCLKPKCISIASSIINSLDENVNPCDDFYKYACGGWIHKNPLPDGHASWGTFGKLTQDNQLILKNVLEDTKRKFSDAERKAKIYYDSCMDRNKVIEKLKAKPLQEFIDLIGGWNISGGFDANAWNLQSKLTLMHNKYNRGGLFEWSVSADEKDSTRNVLDLQQGSFIMPRDYYLNKTDDDEIIAAYLEFMTKIGVLLGGNEATTLRQMKAVLNLERQIAKILIPPEDLRDDQKTYHKMQLSDLNKLAPFIDWVSYFKEAFSTIKRDITDKEYIVVYSPEYFGNLSKLIELHLSDNENKTILVNTIVWSVVHPMVTYLSKPFRDAAKSFSQVLVGSEGTSSQWRYCISDTGSVLGFALGSIFVHSAFRGESKNESKLMIQQIKEAFKDHLEKLTWMDKQTLELAMEKADAITDMIGFPDFILNEKKLNKRYKDLIVKEDQYFKNSIQSNIFMLNEYIKKIDKPTNKSEWDMPPPVVNAYYAPTKNQIAFPAGILQPPFYDVNRPKALNFGAMGVVMGHELTHAFDDQGREYDKKGNLHEWWAHGTILKFKEKMKCFQEQYSQYIIGKDHVNGKQTLGENVADNGGLTSAFHAFSKWSQQEKESILLPGLNFTQNQLFFVGFAQVWCSVNTPEALKIQIRNDPHTPSQYRVIGTLSNSPQFSEAFNCPLGSPMNPMKKCTIW